MTFSDIVCGLVMGFLLVRLSIFVKAFMRIPPFTQKFCEHTEFYVFHRTVEGEFVKGPYKYFLLTRGLMYWSLWVHLESTMNVGVGWACKLTPKAPDGHIHPK